MISFSLALVALLVGYLVYGKLVERVFGIEPERRTPAYVKADGVDYTPMSRWRVFLIQFLNIAGTGPIFGAIMGIKFGPAAYLWIVLGCIFIGAFHDYMSGMISLRKDGLSLPEVLGDELGTGVRYVMRLLSILLLVLVGTVFVVTPADLLAQMTDGFHFSVFNLQLALTPLVWFFIILFYYALATMLPISTLIGRIYPVFGVSLLVMALLACYGIYALDGSVPELTDGLASHHPQGLPVFPLLCITIACGAVSGFHGTQSPIMSRCLQNERDGRIVFYGAMITEGVVALIWAAAAIKFAGSYEHLAEMGSPAVVVHMVCNTWSRGCHTGCAGCGGCAHYIGRYGFPFGPTHHCRHAETQSKLVLEAIPHRHSHVLNSHGPAFCRFRSALALFCLDQSDAGLCHTVGSDNMDASQKEGILDGFAACTVYDGGMYELHNGCTRRLPAAVGHLYGSGHCRDGDCRIALLAIRCEFKKSTIKQIEL